MSSTPSAAASGTVKGGNAQRNDGAWIAILIVGVLLLFACVGYGIYRFMCKTVQDENALRNTTTTQRTNKNKPRPKAQPLPDGWEEHFDDEGTPYYYHEATETTSWDHPSLKKHSRVTSTGSALPPGWEKHQADDGDFYYENSEGAVQWEKP